MLQMEADRLAIEADLADAGLAPDTAERLRRAAELSRDASFDAWIGAMPGDDALFRRLRDDAAAAIEQAAAAAAAGELEDARAAWSDARVACDGCHAAYRPGGLPPGH